jgi:dethiobiotin synthetase
VTLVYCVGTATDVGKTWFGAATLTGLRARGRRVVARKPVQSFDPAEASTTDAHVLAAATGQRAEEVCPPERWFEVPMAPPMAAGMLGRRCPTIAELAVGVDDLAAAADVVWVEGVGGPRSPVAADGDGVDLLRVLRPDLVVLVADAGLGTINAVRLTLAALDGEATIVALNRYDDGDDLHRRNRDWLAERDGADVVVSPAELVTRVSPGPAR